MNGHAGGGRWTMPRADSPHSDAPGAESSAVDENRAAPPAGQSNTATSTARTGAAVDTVLPAKVRPHGESEELVRAHGWIADLPFLAVFAVAVLTLLGLSIALMIHPAGHWLKHHSHWMVAGYGLLFAAV